MGSASHGWLKLGVSRSVLLLVSCIYFPSTLAGDLTPRLLQPSSLVPNNAAIEMVAFGDRLYIVQPGERINSIAKAVTGNSGNWRKIARYNGIKQPKKLHSGQILLIPKQLIRTDRQVEKKELFPVNSPSSTLPEPEPMRVSKSGDDTAYGRADYHTPISSSLHVRRQYIVDDSIVHNDVVLDKSGISRNHKGMVDDEISGEQPQPFKATSYVLNKADIDMFVGEVKVLANVKVDRVAVGNGSVVQVEVLDNGELLTIAQSEGSSSIHLWHKNGQQSDFNVRVSATDPQTRVRAERMIRMRVKMVEFRKSALTRLGIDWGDAMDGPVFATAGDLVSNSLYRPAQSGLQQSLPIGVKPFSSYFGIASKLTSRINFMLTNGDAEMLAEPVLSCRNGGTARFLAGGEVPYPTIAANGQSTIDFKEYGIRLEIAPVVDSSGGVQASILTEISSLDPSVSVQGAPGLLTRRTQTEVNVQANQTIVIAGLLQSDASKDMDRLPGVGNLPVLGKLFRSENVRNNVSELVIFITPEVVDPASNYLTQEQLGIDSSSNRSLNGVRAQLGNLQAD